MFRTLPFQNACQNTRCPRTLVRTLYSVKPFVKCSAKLTNAWHFSCSNILRRAILAPENWNDVEKTIGVLGRWPWGPLVEIHNEEMTKKGV